MKNDGICGKMILKPLEIGNIWEKIWKNMGKLYLNHEKCWKN